MKIDNEATLDWQPFIGHLSWRAGGSESVYLILLTAGEDSSRLYQMEAGMALCPINQERALQYTEIPECACGQCPDAFVSAALIAEEWEKE
jgi:hypothetical protein